MQVVKRQLLATVLSSLGSVVSWWAMIKWNGLCDAVVLQQKLVHPFGTQEQRQTYPVATTIFTHGWSIPPNTWNPIHEDHTVVTSSRTHCLFSHTANQAQQPLHTCHEQKLFLALEYLLVRVCLLHAEVDHTQLVLVCQQTHAHHRAACRTSSHTAGLACAARPN